MKRSSRPALKTVLQLDLGDSKGWNRVQGIPYLYVSCKERKNEKSGKLYVYRRRLGKRLYTESLGSVFEVDLTSVVARVGQINSMIDAGVDVFELKQDKKKQQSQRLKKAREKEQAHKLAKRRTSGKKVIDLIDAFVTHQDKLGTWKNRRKPQSQIISGWVSNHFSVEFQQLSIDLVTSEVVAKEFQTLWLTHSSTPEKILSLLRRAFDWAMRRKWLSYRPNPADSAAVRDLLPRTHLRPSRQHFPFLPPERLPDFMAELLKSESIGAKCLAFQIFCGLRIDNARTALWSQIDLNEKRFVIPREFMKSNFSNNPPHYVPLSDQCVDLLRTLPRFFDKAGNPIDRVFVAYGNSEHPFITEASVYKCLRDLHRKRKEIDGIGWVDPHCFNQSTKEPRIVVPHGLARTDLESWALDPISFDHDAYPDMAIAFIMDHKIEDYGQAYKRRPPLGQMQKILQDWADYLTSANQNPPLGQ